MESGGFEVNILSFFFLNPELIQDHLSLFFLMG